MASQRKSRILMKKFMAVSLVGMGLACVSAANAADVSKLDARVEAAHVCPARVDGYAG